MFITFLDTKLDKYFPKGFFPNVEFSKWQLPKSVLAAALGPHFSLQRLRGPNLTFGKLPLGKLHIWVVATWEIVTWEVALGKMPLGKYLTPKIMFKSIKCKLTKDESIRSISLQA